MINRGKRYWGQNYKNYPYVQYYYGDRHAYFEYEKLLKYISKKHGITATNKWDLVIDFCCFERKEAKSVIRGLNGLVGLYVFISSDSVYDVCEEDIRKEVLIKEEYSVRPEDEVKIKKLNDDEDYGNDKLKCEEYLASHVDRGFPYCCLRLPDVIGPFDSSCRFWGYQKWLKICGTSPIHFNKFTNTRKLSMVYSEDVARLILDMMRRARDAGFLDSVHGHSFNVSFDETYTLFEFLESISKKTGIKVAASAKINLRKSSPSTRRTWRAGAASSTRA